MFRVETRGGASVVWRQAETSVDEPTGSYAPRGKWFAGGRGFRSRAYAHVSEGAASGTDSLTATGITTGQPTLGTPSLGQIHSFSATGITTGVPTLGTPYITSGTGEVVLGSLRGILKKSYPVRAPKVQTVTRY
jgi:hypothetical protein